MHMPASGRSIPAWATWLVAGATTCLVLIPWLRNHAYLRDFYDYGMVISGTARIAAGEQPYVDFATPIQTGVFLFNGWAETLGDGTFQAMTHGAAALIVITMVLFTGLLARRFSGVVAVLLAGALTAMMATQHTIIWYNTVGGLCLAMATWSAAIAPLWRRSHWGWHALTGAALVIGGINKLNFQLVALAGVLAWVAFAAWAQRGEGRRAVATVAGVLTCGIAIPLAIELAFTGASLAQWWENVVRIPLSGRSGDLLAVLDWKFYFAVRHDYYGPMPVQALGAVGVMMTFVAAMIALRQLGWTRAAWVVGAAGFTVASGAGLLATNYEIGYVAVGAWFVLLISLWLGFQLHRSGKIFHVALVLPVVLMGGIAWRSAWEGHRSQFGHSPAARTDYVDAGSVAADFAFLRGTRLPPEISQSLEAGARWRQTLTAEEQQSVFYGPGLEWLERPWPTLKLPGMPLLMQGGTTYGAREETRLRTALGAGGPYRAVLVPEAWDYFGATVAEVLHADYSVRRLGPTWHHYEKLPVDVVSWQVLEFLREFGGNVNSTHLLSQMKMHRLPDNRTLIGVTAGAGEMQLSLPSNRAQGEAVIHLLPEKNFPESAKVRFEVFSLADGKSYPRWSADIGLSDGQATTVVPFPLDAGGSPLRFVVTIPPEMVDHVVAGWRALRILDAVDGPERPFRRSAKNNTIDPATDDMCAALLPPDWPPRNVYVRNVGLEAHGLELWPGGEIWVRLGEMLSEISGVITVVGDTPVASEHGVQVFYLKGPKLDIMGETVMRESNRRFEFKARSSEPNGWLVITADKVGGASSLNVKITGAKRRN